MPDGRPQRTETGQVTGGSRRRQERPGPAIRYRAAKACRRCNEKRVKCDASVRGTPCTRCEERQEPGCAMIQSQRGIYVRKSRAAAPAPPPAADPASVSAQHDEDPAVPPPPPPVSAADAVPAPSGASIVAQPARGLSQSWPTPVASSSVEDNDHDTPSGRSGSSTTLSSYREVSWASLFDHLIESQQADGDDLDKYSITYHGESFPLSIVMRDLRGGDGRHKLHHAGPPSSDPFDSKSSEPESSPHQHPAHMRPEEINYLTAKKAFEAPGPEPLNALVGVFLDRVLPMYPIVNLPEFSQQFEARRVPWILLHAVCFLAATFCPPRVIHSAGFETRRQARWSFYSKAKALFDVGYEGNKVVVLQVCIMLSFWGGGPNMYGNFYSWISTGVTMAEALGCHRSMVGLNIKSQDRSLLKRLWWILVIRDTFCASLIGLPFKINLDHCDIDPLAPDDFQQSTLSLEAAERVLLSGMYQIEATKLSLILRRIIRARFSPDAAPPDFGPSCWKQILTDWRAQVPPQLAWSDDHGPSAQSNIFASCLCIMYNHHVILSDINGGRDSAQQQVSPTGYPGPIEPAEETCVVAAAQLIAAAACAVVIKSDILLAPHELLHGIFVAAIVFYTQTKSRDPLASQLGMAGLTNCKMVLHESRDTWDPSPWITQLLDKLLGAQQASRAIGSEERQTQNTQIMMESMVGAYDGNGMFPAGYDMWQSHPVLGNLFDTALDPTLVPVSPEFQGGPGTGRWF